MQYSRRDPMWKAAMDREFKSLEENGAWELVKPPSGQGIASGTWHFPHTLYDEGNVVKFKARFVAAKVHSVAGH